MSDQNIKKIVKNSYAKIATGSACGCGCKDNSDISKSLGYSQEDIDLVPGANLGLGCGNPLGLGQVKEGQTVLDLGSGAGFDAFLAAERVGARGQVIGIDMTQEMVDRATANAEKNGFKNVEFRLGDIENLPVENQSIDIIISNCVINLAPDKSKVFKDAFRVLKPAGKMYISDIVLLKELTEEQRNNKDLIAGCVAGALLKNDYIDKLEEAGFKVNVLKEDKEISKRQYQGIPLASLTFEAIKN